MNQVSPIGSSVESGARRRAAQSPEYRAELERLRPLEEIARQIIRLRTIHKLSQEELAARVGTTKSAISRLESGQHSPNILTLSKIASAFGSNLVITFEAQAVASRNPEPTLAR